MDRFCLSVIKQKEGSLPMLGQLYQRIADTLYSDLGDVKLKTGHEISRPIKSWQIAMA